MRRLLSYMKKYRKESFIAPLFKLLEASFELIVPLIIAALIDKGIETKNVSLIVKYSFILVLLAVIGWVCAVIAQYYAAKAAVGTTAEIKSSLFRKIQSLSNTEYDTLGNSTMITRMTSDCNQVQNAVNLFLRLFLRAPIIVFGAMIMAFTVSPRAALIFVAVIPLLAIVVYGIMLLTVPLYKKVQSKLDSLLAITRENLNGARVIRAFCREDDETERFDKTNTELSTMQRFVGKLSALTNPVTFLLINVAIIVLIYVGAIQVNVGELSQGEVIALYNYMSQILVELIKLANLIVTVTKGVASMHRIDSVMELKSSISFDGNGAVENGSVVFKNVGLTYKNAGAPSLTDISFEAKAGDTVGIIGGTGSGKSSVINLIPRFYEATEGEILIDGKDIKSFSEDGLRDMIGVVPQHAKLFKGTIRDNIRVGNQNATDDEITEALKEAQAYDFVKEKDGYLDYMIESGGRNLSGGQKQRLTVARAIVRKPRILILDDSASALDYRTDAALREAIKGLSFRPTTFIVSQRASSVLHADKILVLEDGECVGYGTHGELIEGCEVYKEIYYCQFPDEMKGGAR
ncbi:MAG: ABC transporter ATP-binding protein [Clostridia bacterium]|nr:ABC transporter ATP-binding protein [Clostridia bacterium]